MSDLADALARRAGEGGPVTWSELASLVRASAEWTGLGEYEDYMGDDL